MNIEFYIRDKYHKKTWLLHDFRILYRQVRMVGMPLRGADDL